MIPKPFSPKMPTFKDTIMIKDRPHDRAVEVTVTAPEGVSVTNLLHAAMKLEDLRILSGNRLEALRGDRKGQHSIRINDQFRLCFRWTSDGAEEVEICDYH